ncbi:hypothetical protein H8E77_17535 [bacterium]|nr:hypothetical protein [bacterium]
MRDANEILVDNTVFSNFASIHRLDVLQKVMHRVFITQQIYDEVIAGILAGYDFQQQVQAEVIKKPPEKWIYITNIRDAEISLYQKLLITLGKGEASGIATAKVRNWGFLTDDRKARRIAQEQGIKLSGTLGILRSAVIRQVLTAAEADNLLGEMIKRGYHSPYTSINQLMK